MSKRVKGHPHRRGSSAKRGISRRDFLGGSLAFGAAGSMVSGSSAAESGAYPPALTGLRGSHEGAFEAAHALAMEGHRDWQPAAEDDSTDYDLVVVGGGISGLAAAYFYRREQPDARILILDNHDDFGGHAKRNELLVDGTQLIGYGGSQSLEAPSAYSEVASGLLADLQVDLDGFNEDFDRDFYRRHGLRTKLFFDTATWGESALLPGQLLADLSLLELPREDLDVPAVLARAPLNDAERAELTALLTVREDALPEVALGDLEDYLYSISYETFLKRHGGLRSERLLTYLRNMPAGYFGVGTDAVPALEAMLFGLPGLNKTGVPGANWLARQAVGWLVEPYIHHYPDGNAAIARALVRTLIPSISPAGNARQLVLERFDYGELDRPEHNVRIRLSSTIITAANRKGGVAVQYVNGGRVHAARGRHAVLACYNMMIPHLCPELPEQQKAALKRLVKAPLVYTNVALRNWTALAQAGVGMAMTPGAFHDYFMVDFPVSLPGYPFSTGPEAPVLLHFSAALTAPGLPPREQHRIGRAKLLGTPFSTIEADVRGTLEEILGAYGFDADRDMAAITVNRWPHGYAYGHHSLFDPDYEPGAAPHEIGRTPHGNITIANSDAGARAYLDEAIDQGHRAVMELLS